MTDAVRQLGLVEFLVLALATHRVTRLLIEDTILDRPRSWVMWKSPPLVEKLLTCPWCLGWHVSLWAGALYLIAPVWAVALALPWALSSAVGLLAARELQGEVQAFGVDED